MATETTQRMVLPSCPGLPTVFITSRSRSSSERFSAWRRSPVRSTISRRKRSTSSAAILRKFASSASPDSSCSLSMSRVFGRDSGAPPLVEVSEQRQPPLHQGRGAAAMPGSVSVPAAVPGPGPVPVPAVEPRDVVVDQLGRGRVVAHDDEAGRDLDARRLPQREGLLVVPVERFERGLQLHGEAQGVERLRLAPPPLRHLPPDVLPEVAELRHLAARDVVRHRHPRQLDDAAFDGVHQREVAHRPGEQRPLGVAGPAQEEGSGGEVDDTAHAPACGLRFRARPSTAGRACGSSPPLSGRPPSACPLRPRPPAFPGSSGAPRRSGPGRPSCPSARASRAGASGPRSRQTGPRPPDPALAAAPAPRWRAAGSRAA